MNNKILDELERTYQDISKSVKNEEYIKGCKNMYESCRAIIEKYSEEPKWIPCSERLPEIYDEKSGMAEDVGRNFLITDVDGYVYEDTFWKYGMRFDNNAVAWQSLPEPYQPKGE